MPYVDPTVACQPYVTPADLCCEGEETAIDCDGAPSPRSYRWTDEQIIQAATNMMFRRTCFRWPGLCTRTVIPCICHQRICECGRFEPEIVLTSDYPIQSVISVQIVERDGTIVNLVDGVDYRLDENARIVRLGGAEWPTRRNGVSIQYVTGRLPPIEIKMATAELACQIKAACEGGENCKLPAHVKSVTRRGVQIEVNDVIALMMSGLTGIPIIDHVLTVHGGNCRKSVMFDALMDHRVDRRVT